MANKGAQRGAARLQRQSGGGGGGVGGGRGRRNAKQGAPVSFLTVKRGIVILCTILLLDIFTAISLILFFNCNDGHFFDFTNCGGVELFAVFVRAFCVPLLCFVGYRWGKPPETESEALKIDGEEMENRSLLGEENETDGTSLLEPGNSEVERAWLERRAWWWKNGSIAGVFVISTCFQVALGVKAILAPLPETTVNRPGVQTCIFLAILMCNLELFVAKKFIETLTAEEGVFVKTSHDHRMFLRQDIGWTMCDRCHQRIRESSCYNCATCDWDVCFTCIRKDLRKERKKQEQSENSAAAGDESEEEEELTTWDYIKRGGGFLRPHWGLVTGAIVCLTLQTVSRVLLPSYTGQILDSVIPGHSDTSAFRAALTGFIAVNVALGLLSGASRLMFSYVSQRMETLLRKQMFTRILGQSIDFFDSATTGDLMAKLNDDVRNTLSPVQMSVPRVFGSLLTLAGGLIMCLRTSWRLSLLAFTILGPLTVITTTYSKWASLLWSRMWGINSTMSDTAKESFTNIRTIRVFGREDAMLSQYSHAADERLKIGLKDAWAGGGSAALTQYMELALQALVLAYGGLAILSTPAEGPVELTIGNLITFQLYWNMLSGAYSGISDQLNSFVKAAGAAQRVIRLLDTLPAIDPEEGTPIRRVGDIELQHVRFRYSSRPENIVLQDVSLKIARGSVVALVGKSGGGKSTLVHLLCRNYDPESGSILVDGHDLKTVKQKDYRKLIGIVQQDTELFNESIERNITFGVDSYTKEELYAAAKKSNCYDFIMGMEEGFATKVGERGVKLSGGQKQRIAIARVMMKKPEFLLLDEATSALDAESEAAVQDALDLLMRDGQVTVVLVAHRLSTVMNAHKICVIDQGTVVESGTHTELLAKKGIYSQLVRRQVTKLANTLPQDGGAAAAAAAATGGRAGKAATVDDLFEDLKNSKDDLDGQEDDGGGGGGKGKDELINLN